MYIVIKAKKIIGKQKLQKNTSLFTIFFSFEKVNLGKCTNK